MSDRSEILIESTLINYSLDPCGKKFKVYSLKLLFTPSFYDSKSCSTQGRNKERNDFYLLLPMSQRFLSIESTLINYSLDPCGKKFKVYSLKLLFTPSFYDSKSCSTQGRNKERNDFYLLLPMSQRFLSIESTLINYSLDTCGRKFKVYSLKLLFTPSFYDSKGYSTQGRNKERESLIARDQFNLFNKLS